MRTVIRSEGRTALPPCPSRSCKRSSPSVTTGNSWA